MSLESKLLRPDYRLWAAKSEGRQWVEQCIEHPPEPRSGLCPELLADFRIPKPPECSQGAQRAVFCAVRVADFLAEGAGWGASPGCGGELGCQAQQVLKKFVRLASAFPSPPTRSLSNRKGRGRRRGGREREPRRAGEGRCLELNSCVLIDYRLWAAKSEGRQWVEHCIEQCIEHPPEPRSGLCPELLADFRIPNLLGARRGTEGSFLCSLSSRFSGRGGGVGSLPRAWRRVGVPGAAGA